MNGDKYRTLFIEESREHLDGLSRLLLEVEKTTDNRALVDEIFRHAHSIKGMAASMAYGPIEQLAHKLEDIVGDYRNRRVPIPSGTVDLLLRSLDALAAQVINVADDQPIESFADLLADLTRAHAADALAPHLPPPISMDPAVAQNVGPWVTVHFAPDARSPAVRAFLAHKRLATLGPIVVCHPPLEAIRRGELDGRRLSIQFGVAVDPTAVTAQLATVVEIERVELAAPEATQITSLPATNDALATEIPKAATSVRVRTEVLDDLLDTVGDIFIARERLRLLLGDGLAADARAGLDALGARIREIHRQVMALRLMPVSTLTERYPRLVRDLARRLDKSAELEVIGSEIEIDRGILEHLDTALVHLVRNAIDHGIESADERRARGKPAAGKVRITASRDRDAVIVVVADDGAGLDAETLKRAAIAKGLLSESQAEQLSNREAYFLICLPGFSTKSQVSEVSGRGVGMDAVRDQVESLGGSMDIEAEVGSSTRISLRLPLTLAIAHALLVNVGKNLIAVPIAKVVAVRELESEVLRPATGGRYLSFQHALVPVVELAEHLRVNDAPLGMQGVVIEDGRDLAALAVQQIVGYREVVVKPLGLPLEQLGWFSGAAILGDGRPMLMLDVAHAMRARPVAGEPAR